MLIILIDTNEKGETKMDILQLLGSYCFPIVACLGMGWYVKYREDKHSEAISTLNRDHKEEVSKMVAALNNNTLALTQLSDYLRDKDE